MANFNSQIYNPLTDELTDRQKEVLERRLGIGREEETLQAIGEDPDFGVTRERIRQIEAASLNILRDAAKEHAHTQNFLEQVQTYLANHGGVSKKDELQARLASAINGVTKEHLDLLAEATRTFGAEEETETEHAYYYADKNAQKQFKTFLANWKKQLNKNKEEVLQGSDSYYAQLASFRNDVGVSEDHAESYLAISKEIKENPYGDIGLASWEEINPSTVRDKIYLAMQKHGEPAHFTEVAELVNEAGFDDKVALASTCHNEVIKDDRFVLVGRGMYALAEDGHEPGTAKDVIHRVLKESGPMTSNEVQLAVQKTRLYKPNTIFVNLQNKDMFKRTDDGKYAAREI